MSVRIGRSVVGSEYPVYVIGEIGLNHNGDVDEPLGDLDVAVVVQPDLTDDVDGVLAADDRSADAH